MDFSGKKTGGGCHLFLQGIFQTQDQTQVSCLGNGDTAICGADSELIGDSECLQAWGGGGEVEVDHKEQGPSVWIQEGQQYVRRAGKGPGLPERRDSRE